MIPHEGSIVLDILKLNNIIDHIQSTNLLEKITFIDQNKFSDICIQHKIGPVIYKKFPRDSFPQAPGREGDRCC